MILYKLSAQLAYKEQDPFILLIIFMEIIRKRLQNLVVFIDILRIIEIIAIVTFGFYHLYLKFSILLTMYKILYIVLILLAIAMIILLNNCFSCFLKGYLIILENNYQDIEERKNREKQQKTKKPSSSKKKMTNKKKSANDKNELG